MLGRISHNKKTWVTRVAAAAGAAIWAFGAAMAVAATLNTQGDIKIRDSLTITEVKSINFGVIEKPTSTVNMFVGSFGNHNGTATVIDASDITNGEYLITGSSLDTISIQATDLGNEPGLALTTISGRYDGVQSLNLTNGVTGQAAPGAGETLFVGAKIVVQSTVTEGDYQPGFQIEVAYD